MAPLRIQCWSKAVIKSGMFLTWRRNLNQDKHTIYSLRQANIFLTPAEQAVVNLDDITFGENLEPSLLLQGSKSL